MKKTATNAFTGYLQGKYDKAQQRLERAMTSGRFAQFTQRKKAQLLNRLSRYARQLGIGMKQSLVAAGIAAGLLLCNPAQAQTFAEQTGTANPLNGVDVGTYSAPTFEDIDNDGDKDAFIGEFNGTILYYKNTGTAASPTFTVQTGAANPFNGVDVGRYSTPTFEDIDNDGDKDAFIGEFDGIINYYKNTPAVLPVKMLYFSGKTVDKTNVLTWATATEQNNAGFEVQRSTDGTSFSKIGLVRGAGNSTSQKEYTFTDNGTTAKCCGSTASSSTYYRLKQIDLDNQFEYSNTISLGARTATTLAIYPNPSTGIFTLDGQGWSGQTAVTVTNSLGQNYQIAIANNQIDLTDLASGVYFLQVLNDGEPQVIKLVKL